MEANSTQPMYWVKYNLHKDGSTIEDGFYEVENTEKHTKKLKKDGYTPIRKYNTKQSK